MKKAMNALDIYACLTEVRKLLHGARVLNVYGIDHKLFMFKVRRPGDEPRLLVVEPASRLHMTRFSYRMPKIPPPLVMGFRKYLRGGRIVEVRQVGFDRIVEVVIERGGERYRVIAELLPRGVIALCDEGGLILHLSESREMRDRVLKRGVGYSYPPLNETKPWELSAQEVLERLKAGRDVVRGIVRGLKLPGEVAEEICYRVGLAKNTPPDTLGLNDASRIVSSLLEIAREAERSHGYIVYEGERPITVTPFKPTMLSTTCRVEEYSSFNEALDEYFTTLSSKGLVERNLKHAERDIERIKAAISRQRELISKYVEKAVVYKAQADAIMAELGLLNEFIECVRREASRLGDWEQAAITCTSRLGLHFTGVESDKRLVRLVLGEHEVVIDTRLTAYENAAKYYEKYKKFKKKARRGEEALKELKDKLTELVKEAEVRRTSLAATVRRREWYERYHWLITSDGLLAVGGMDASQNERVVKKYLSDNDIFIHAEIRGGSAVVLKVGGRIPSERSLKEAAYLAACYSKAWKAGYSSVEVYWVWGSQVSKSPPPGHYLPKGAFIIKGEKNKLGLIPLRLALGIARVGNNVKVIVGPEDLVSSKTRWYVVIVPGDLSASEVAKKIKSLLYAMVPDELKPIVSSIEEGEILKRIPGPSKILHRREELH